MPRTSRTAAAALMQEARAIEVFASEVAAPIESMPEYWELSTRLITLVADIEEINGRIVQPEEDDPELLALRRRLRAITARLSELATE
jgi:hypothetical protein